MSQSFLKILWSQKYNLLAKIADTNLPLYINRGFIISYEVWNPPVVNAHMFQSGMRPNVLLSQLTQIYKSVTLLFEQIRDLLGFY